jgi:hypothetical protein
MALESLDNISTFSIVIIGLYLMIACATVPFTVMGENVRNVILNNPYFQHMLTFYLIFFLIVLLNKIPPSVPLQGLYAIIDNPNSELLNLFGISILIYALFIMVSRASLMFTSVILMLLAVMFVLNTMASKKLDEKNEEEYKKYKLSHNILFIIIIILCTTGSILYVADKYKQYGDKYGILTFIFEDPKFNSASKA